MPNTAKTLVLLAHPNLSNSRVNAALADVARQEEHVTVHDLYAAYPDFRIDVAREQRLLLAHDSVTLQFPFQWYSTPSLLKLWLDEVLTYGWAFGEGGTALHGKTLRFAISTSPPATRPRRTALTGSTASRWRNCCAPWRPPPTSLRSRIPDPA
ncbi:NAD(P)H-dependent oxidoreductase [Frankia sp. Cas3]|uniref:NAD(P)H-dependent oxidoreductase n=1 Tax=Frankia sp. Cas3 TaxID=3073926 RepID=UPI002AD2BABA|nr:NAD(P)H-dependent oxidoreductase [Frankia sp. Cas3]